MHFPHLLSRKDNPYHKIYLNIYNGRCTCQHLIIFYFGNEPKPSLFVTIPAPPKTIRLAITQNWEMHSLKKAISKNTYGRLDVIQCNNETVPIYIII